MVNELTASLTIWPCRGTRTTPVLAGAQMQLWENFRPVWKHVSAPDAPRTRAVAQPNRGLATALALQLAASGELTPMTGLLLPHGPHPLRLTGHQEHQLFGLFQGASMTLLRFDACCISDRELRCARHAGVTIELVDLFGLRPLNQDAR